MGFTDYLEQEIDQKRILTDRCNIKNGTRFFLRIPRTLLVCQPGVEYGFIWKRGAEEWDMPHGKRVIRAGDLPRRHKSKPINRMINYARSSDGYRLDDSKLLLRLLAEDFWCKVGWYPEGWMMCPQPYISIDLHSMDAYIGRHVIDNAQEHSFIEKLKAA